MMEQKGELDFIQEELGRGKLWKSQSVDYFSTGRALSMEIGTVLELKLDIIEGRKKSRLIGMDPGNYILVQMPDLRSHVLEKVFPGSEVIVQYLHEGTVYGFRSSIKGLIFSPAKLMFLEYPKMIFLYELRSQKRMECFLPAEVMVDGQVRACVIRDISVLGCKLVIKASREQRFPVVEIEKPIGLRFPLPGFEGEQDVEGKVRNFQTNKHEMAIGVQFGSLDQGTRKRIIEYISRMEPF